MNKEKQGKILNILSANRYRIKDGELYSKTKKLKGNILPTGYIQVTLYNGKRGALGVNVLCYLHCFIYMYHNGAYDTTLQIDHIDRNVNNNKIENLRAVTVSNNNTNRGKFVRPEFRTIRKEEIANIRKLHKEGINQTKIAEQLNLNRTSVCVTVNKIKAGHKLKYE